ncbi:hypothetical protein F0562_007015 [Nyssa sinensis]|uniref:Uncharacterized protein n=1 Tax=Nyssa sinensis TaxID=561372 RepID=A0A5J5A5L4_9ASTE|nr:hypothetical protein F0562_007015 [Nyssa sinensis]
MEINCIAADGSSCATDVVLSAFVACCVSFAYGCADYKQQRPSQELVLPRICMEWNRGFDTFIEIDQHYGRGIRTAFSFYTDSLILDAFGSYSRFIDMLVLEKLQVTC